MIKLPDGDYVRASDILKVSKPYYDTTKEQWMSSIAYINKIYPDTVSFHVYEMSKTFVRTSEKANVFLDRFISKINELV